MVIYSSLKEMGDALNGVVQLNTDRTLTVGNPELFRAELIDALIETAVFSEDSLKLSLPLGQLGGLLTDRHLLSFTLNLHLLFSCIFQDSLRSIP